jgi:phosphonate transport system permease protein
MEKDILKHRRQQYIIFFVVLIIAVVASGIITEYNFVRTFTSIPKAFAWLVNNFMPDQKALDNLPNIIEKLVETAMIAVVSTIVATPIGLFFALMGSKTTRVNNFLSTIARGIASIFRNIPVAAWAMIFLFSFNQSTFTGFLALGFVSFGFLTRTFMEAIDETAESSVEALRATGATYFQMIVQSVIPESLPQIISWVLFTIETNIRSATLVGILTGTGIGFAFDLYYKNDMYPSAALVVVGVVIVVLTIELISNRVRKAIL